jgi:AraC-like DNA-binding protein
MSLIATKYYLTEVDKLPDSIYCYHDAMGENLVQPHTHQKAQLLYTEGGVVHISIPEKTYFLPARHYLWIPAGVEHSIHASSPDIIMRNLYFPTSQNDVDFYANTAIYPVNDLLMQLFLFSNRWHGDIVPSDIPNFTIALAIKALLPSISAFSLPLALPYPKDERLTKLIDFMRNNLHNPIVFSEICQQFGFSQRSLSRLFQADLGMSFIQFYTILRILKALQLLLEEKLPVNDVAIMVGYSSIPTFSNTFYNLMGFRPSDYAKMKRVLE